MKKSAPAAASDGAHAARIDRWESGAGWSVRRDLLAVEEPLEIRVDTQSVNVTMRTPGNDDELAAGYLYTEGVVRARNEIRGILPYSRNADGNVMDVFIADDAEIDRTRLARRGVSLSSCGLCGKTSIDAVRLRCAAVRKRFTVDRDTILGLQDQMRHGQTAFESTGGLHAAALFDARGVLRVLREDIGRHNAVDKVIGHAFLGEWQDLDAMVLVVSGRASFEIVQKALAARIAFVCAVSAPSQLAVELAQESGQTLVGFLRPGRFNVYAGRKRIGPARPARSRGAGNKT